MFLKIHGKKVPSHKSISINKPIEDALAPDFVYYPLFNGEIEYKKVLEIGSQVKKGQVILMRDDRFAHPICSSVSGAITGVKKMWHSSGFMIDMLEIENDFKEEAIYTSSTEFDFTKDELISKVKNAGIVGLGGAGFPTYVKYLPNQKADYIIINAAECEPYITCDYASIIENTKKLIRGLKYIMKANGAKKGVIAIKKKYKDAIDVLKKELVNHKNIKLYLLKINIQLDGKNISLKKLLKKLMLSFHVK